MYHSPHDKSFKSFFCSKYFYLVLVRGEKDWSTGFWAFILPSALFASMNAQLLLDITPKHLTDITASKLQVQ